MKKRIFFSLFHFTIREEKMSIHAAKKIKKFSFLFLTIFTFFVTFSHLSLLHARRKAAQTKNSRHKSFGARPFFLKMPFPEKICAASLQNLLFRV